MPSYRTLISPKGTVGISSKNPSFLTWSAHFLHTQRQRSEISKHSSRRSLY